MGRQKVLCEACNEGKHFECWLVNKHAYCVCWLYDHDIMHPQVERVKHGGSQFR